MYLSSIRTALNMYTVSSAEAVREEPAADCPAAGSSPNAVSTCDSFVHTPVLPDTELALQPYNENGSQGGQILPDRYYGGGISGKVFYKGGSVTYTELLEEAVTTGQYEPDESQSIWNNIAAAERILITDKGRPLVPWSDAMYSEDGQYRLRIENGEVTGMTAAFYYDRSGKKITAEYIAVQLASGILPADLDGDWSFLAHFDPQLYQDSLEVGNAVRAVRENAAEASVHLKVPKLDEDDLFSPLILLLGKEGARAALPKNAVKPLNLFMGI